MESIIDSLTVSVTMLTSLVAQHTQTKIAYADVLPPPAIVQLTNSDRAEKFARQYAKEYGVSYDQLWRTMTCENKWHDPKLQSYVITKSGAREDSWGVSQWFLPAGNKTEDGRVITKAIAQDMELSIKTMAWYFSKGWEKKWSCYKKIFSPKKE